MRYIKPPDFPDVKAFQEKYRKAIDNITTVLTADASGKSVNELNKSINDALNAAMEYLTKVNRDYVKKQLPNAFDDYREDLTKSPEMTKAEVNEELQKQGFKYSPKALARDTYIELQESVQAATNGTRNRVNSIIEQLRKTDEDTVYNVQQAIIQDLQTNGVTVEYANGAKQPLDAYASMAARSARIETANLGAIGRAMENGTDLVIMTTMPMCCKYCGAYQDKVYSISGKDKRFPALFKTVLKNGYALPHPNCRHEFIPYYEDMEDPDDVEKMIGKSKIKYDRKGQLADVRSTKDIEQYKQWQAGNRQRNAESKAYEKYLAYCEEQGVEPKYTTLGGFRRARRAERGSTAWNNSHNYKQQ